MPSGEGCFASTHDSRVGGKTYVARFHCMPSDTITPGLYYSGFSMLESTSSLPGQVPNSTLSIAELELSLELSS